MYAHIVTAIHSLKTLAGITSEQAAPRATLIFVSAFFYFLCSQILTNSTFVYHLGFYGLLLPSFIYLAFTQRGVLRNVPFHVGSLGLIAFFSFVILHAALGQFADQSLIKIMRDTLLNGAFMVMALSIFSAPRINSLALLRSFILTTIIMVPISYAMRVYDPTQPHHFLPIGRAHNPIPIGNLYAFAALVSLWLYFQKQTSAGWKILCIVCYALTVLAIIITTQRGPLLGLAVASGIGVLLLCKPRVVLLASGVGFTLGLDYFMFFTRGAGVLDLEPLYQLVTQFFAQRDSYRLMIWQHAFELIVQKPWQGYGLHAKFVMDGVPGAVNPHNLFISTLYYTGIAGLGLLLVPLLTAFVIAFRGRRTPYHQLCLILLVHAVVACLTNYGQVVKAPAPLWTIYWLPIAMALARAAVKPNAQKLSVGQA